MDPLTKLPRGSLCQRCRRQRFAIYAGVADDVNVQTTAEPEDQTCAGETVGDEAMEESQPLHGLWKPGDRLLEISASTFTGVSCKVQVPAAASVSELKQLIQRELAISWTEQQLVCGLEVLQPNSLLVKDVAALQESEPHLTVIRRPAIYTCFQRIILKGSQAAVDGRYTRVNSNCYASDTDRTLRIFRYEADVAWPAAWYIERLTSGAWHGIYYAVPDQTMGVEDGADEALQGYPLPVNYWEPWTGYKSEPGSLPAPEVTPLS